MGPAERVLRSKPQCGRPTGQAGARGYPTFPWDQIHLQAPEPTPVWLCAAHMKFPRSPVPELWAGLWASGWTHPHLEPHVIFTHLASPAGHPTAPWLSWSGQEALLVPVLGTSIGHAA